MDIKELIKRKKQSLSNDKTQSSYEDYMTSQIDNSNKDQFDKLNLRIESKRKEIEKFKIQISSIEKNLSDSTKDLSDLIERLDLYNDQKKNGFYFVVSERKHVDIPDGFSEFIDELSGKSRYGKIIDTLISNIKIGEIDIFFGNKVEGIVVPIMIKDLGEEIIKLINERIALKSNNKESIVVSDDKITYVGDYLSWNDIVNIFNNLGFSQDPEFDMLNS
jgi:chromosome segregation ATPase